MAYGGFPRGFKSPRETTVIVICGQTKKNEYRDTSASITITFDFDILVNIKSVVDWSRSILVNGILYLRLFGDLEMTSSKYQNVKINFDSGSNLRRALGNMYHHVINDSLRQARVSCLMEGFPRVWVSQGTPKQPYQLCFELLLLPGAWNHVSPCDTWF